MRRKIVILSTIVVLLAVLSYGTVAQYVAQGTAKNIITSGNVRAVLHSCTSNEQPAQTEVLCLPGEVVDRIVTVENEGEQPFYVRIQLKKYVKDSDLNADDCINLNLNDEDWIYKEGYYYYVDALQPGQITEPLFTQVEIDGPNVNNDYLGETLMLDVSAYAVQSKNNGQTVWDVIGWPMS